MKRNSHYVEGDSVPFRLLFTTLSVGEPYSVTLQYDTTEDGRHGYDYMTSYDRTESVGNNPCSGVAGCSGVTTFPIPADPHLINANSSNVPQVPGGFSLFGGTIVSVSAYSYEGTFDGRSSASLTITFIASNSTPVLAWGSHLASQTDWGQDLGASNIPGAPFHVRVYQFDGKNVGSQDRAVSNVGVP